MKLLKCKDNPMSKMDKFFHIPIGIGTQKSLYDMAKYANYHVDELRMDFYLKMMRTLAQLVDIYSTYLEDKTYLHYASKFGLINPNCFLF